MLAEGSFEDGAYPLGIGLLYRLAAQQVSAPGIGNGQRVDARSIAGAEPALEVGAPDAVGLHGMLKRLRVGFCFASPLARYHQPGALDDLAEGAGGRPAAPRLIAIKNPLQLARTPAHVRFPQRQHCLFDLRRRLVGMMPRSPVQFHQPAGPMLTITPQPYIASLPRDPIAAAQLPHRLFIALILIDKAQLLVHHTARSPGHEELVPPHPLVAVSGISSI